MTISAPYEDAATIGTTEYSLPNDGTTLTPITVDGIYQVYIDFNAMTVAEQFEVKMYEKIQSGGTQFVLSHSILTGIDGGLAGGILVLPSLLLLHGWDVTVKKLAGTDRSIGWSIRAVT